MIGDGAGRISGGLLDLDAGGDVTVTHTSRGANFTIDVTNLNIDGNDVTVAAGQRDPRQQPDQRRRPRRHVGRPADGRPRDRRHLRQLR